MSKAHPQILTTREHLLSRQFTSSTATSTGPFKKVLIANRGEIAIRIAKAAAGLNIPTLSIYSGEDASALHASVTSESVQISSSNKDMIPYLDIEEVIQIAKTNSCDCIHPGYGFLSENFDFVKRCEEEGLKFIGPTSTTINMFGSKVKAKALAKSVNVPVVDGSENALKNYKEAAALIKNNGNINFPVMLKASFGGGGKGMRIVENENDLEESFMSCQREAEAAFGNGDIFVEQYITSPQHIEVQILADSKGNIVHLFERDCSVQLRNQKVMEIAPAPNLSEEIRANMLQDAIKVAEAANYVNAGTVEFLYSPESKQYFFIEVNPRIQVEHTVTEQITGLDLVESQFLIAAGESLSDLGIDGQNSIMARGFAMQARVVAQSTGTLQAYKEPSGAGIRVDACGYVGLSPPNNYDPLLAKVVCYHPTSRFEKVVTRMVGALKTFHILGITTNIGSLLKICENEDFKTGNARTSFLAEFPDIMNHATASTDSKVLSLLDKNLGQTGEGFDTNASVLPRLPSADGQVSIPCGISATIVEYRVARGNFIQEGDIILIVSAMKMETVLKSPVTGVVTAVHENLKQGDSIAPNDAIAVIDPNLTESDAIENTIQSEKDAVSWLPEIEELRTRQEFVKKMGGEERIERHRSNGKLTVRERIDILLDNMESFNEIGSTVGRFTYDEESGKMTGFLNPSNIVIGQGFVDGRPICVSGDDFTVKGGSAEGSISAGTAYGDKRMMIERLAREIRVPIIRLIDGNSGGGSVGSYSGTRRTYVPEAVGYNQQILMLSEVPVVAVLLGSVVGIGAARAVAAHFNVIVQDKAQLMVAGPPVVIHATGETLNKEELGGAAIVSASGAVDNVAANETEAIAMAKKFLSYLPGSVLELPTVIKCNDPINRRDERLLSVIPKKQRGTFDVRDIITMTCDEGSWFEIGPNWAKNIVTGFARIDGHPVGVMSSDCRFNGGCVDTPGAYKLRRFADMVELFHLPVYMLVDMPGFEVGSNSERTAVIRHGVALMASLYSQTVPRYTIIIRRCFGVAGQALAGSNEGRVTQVSPRVAWPSGDWGSLPLEGGIEAANKRRLAAHPNPDQLRQELFDQLSKYRSPFRTAEAFGIEDIIDPRDTRPRICAWVKLAYRVLNHGDHLKVRPGFFVP